MTILENLNGEETAVVKMEVSKEGDMVAGIDPSEVKSYTDENGNTKYYVEMLVTLSIKKAYEGDENTQKKRDVRANRCTISGKRGKGISCPETNKCSECPYFDKKQAGIISLDKYNEDGGKEIEDKKAVDPEAEAVYKDTLRNLISLANERNPRLVKIIKLLLEEYDKKELPGIVGISKTTVYEDIKIIGDLFKQINEML